MNIWIMNLKDNREYRPDNLIKTKFEFCKSKNIVGIGWATEESRATGDVGFSAANNAIDSFEIGDLVWVKDYFSGEEKDNYYICKIMSKAQETDNYEMNNNDIGKFCYCEYNSISDLPVGLENERLVPIHTIERANENVAAQTKAFYDSIKSKKQSRKKKIVILVLIIAFAVLLSAIFIPKTITSFKRKNHPILPNGLYFGMDYKDVFQRIKCAEEGEEDELLDGWYDCFSKSYDVILNPNNSKVIRDDLSNKLGLEVEDDFVTLCFNPDKKLYQIHYEPKGYYEYTEKQSQDTYNVLCDYYKYAFKRSDISSKKASFSSSSVLCDFTKDFLRVTIISNDYKPQISEISENSLANALVKLDYNVGEFNINLYTLMEMCVSNMDITYSSMDDAISLGTLDSSDDIVKKISEDYTEYAATSYIVTIHGDVCQNPDLPYMKTKDVDIIKILMIFNDYGELEAHKILEANEDLNTYAILTMFG